MADREGVDVFYGNCRRCDVLYLVTDWADDTGLCSVCVRIVDYQATQGFKNRKVDK